MNSKIGMFYPLKDICQAYTFKFSSLFVVVCALFADISIKLGAGYDVLNKTR